jgi:hypothetical protein
MSDSAQLLAAMIDGDATERAAQALAWLVERQIVEATPTDSGLGKLAHRPGAKALDAVQKPPAHMKNAADFRQLRTNGMDVEYTRRPRLQPSGDEMPVFECPIAPTTSWSELLAPMK